MTLIRFAKPRPAAAPLRRTPLLTGAFAAAGVVLAAAPAAAQMNPLSPDAMSSVVSGLDPSTVAAAIAAASTAQGSGGSPTSTGDATTGDATVTLPSTSVPSFSNGATLDAPGATISSKGAPLFDYRANLQSPAFGARLFTGAFARAGASQFNPDYVIGAGDRIVVRLWGAFNFNQIQTVDAHGNIFLPSIGPVNVLGVRNQNLQGMIERAVARSYKSNVYSYASIAEAQPVRIFVGGFVRRPGLYDGTSMDGVLHYLDLAGGIDPERGSFIQVQVKRGEQVRARFNLYEFLFRGVMPLINLSDGDVVFVGPRQNTVTVSGLAENANVFEFPVGSNATTADLVMMARPLAAATNMRITRNTGTVKNVEYYPISQAGSVALVNGDEVEFTADKKPGTITVRVEGEHDSAQEYVLPYGSHLGDLLQKVQFSSRSAPENIQLFRQSVKQRQKDMLAASLKSLEAAALNARSGTSEEARLRAQEADLILKWVDRAKQVDPMGQVVLGQGAARNDLLLENGDRLKVPGKDGLVLISGEVLFPNAVTYDRGAPVAGYVRQAGGYTQKGNARRIVVAHQNGSFDEVGDNSRAITAGDEILVLPKVDSKSRQLFKDLTQILYQIAVSARVVLAL
ncbi:polysaccharide biosynthesis/export family protein [Novosphingobium huizhouense]|uniref:polysaccharide biosynthesis/export family protein n=1 Tax=Novosphingobium huizhouense TaxID=2866625 RepID=UPI001CD88014|nr:polysaccharide biosynthesis/export family protein [Novosphingobium huizhouense]